MNSLKLFLLGLLCLGSGIWGKQTTESPHPQPRVHRVSSEPGKTLIRILPHGVELSHAKNLVVHSISSLPTGKRENSTKQKQYQHLRTYLRRNLKQLGQGIVVPTNLTKAQSQDVADLASAMAVQDDNSYQQPRKQPKTSPKAFQNGKIVFPFDERLQTLLEKGLSQGHKRMTLRHDGLPRATSTGKKQAVPISDPVAKNHTNRMLFRIGQEPMKPRNHKKIYKYYGFPSTEEKAEQNPDDNFRSLNKRWKKSLKRSATHYCSTESNESQNDESSIRNCFNKLNLEQSTTAQWGKRRTVDSEKKRSILKAMRHHKRSRQQIIPKYEDNTSSENKKPKSRDYVLKKQSKLHYGKVSRNNSGPKYATKTERLFSSEDSLRDSDGKHFRGTSKVYNDKLSSVEILEHKGLNNTNVYTVSNELKKSRKRRSIYARRPFKRNNHTYAIGTFEHSKPKIALNESLEDNLRIYHGSDGKNLETSEKIDKSFNKELDNEHGKNHFSSIKLENENSRNESSNSEKRRIRNRIYERNVENQELKGPDKSSDDILKRKLQQKRKRRPNFHRPSTKHWPNYGKTIDGETDSTYDCKDLKNLSKIGQGPDGEKSSDLSKEYYGKETSTERQEREGSDSSDGLKKHRMAHIDYSSEEEDNSDDFYKTRTDDMRSKEEEIHDEEAFDTFIDIDPQIDHKFSQTKLLNKDNSKRIIPMNAELRTGKLDNKLNKYQFPSSDAYGDVLENRPISDVDKYKEEKQDDFYNTRTDDMRSKEDENRDEELFDTFINIDPETIDKFSQTKLVNKDEPKKIILMNAELRTDKFNGMFGEEKEQQDDFYNTRTDDMRSKKDENRDEEAFDKFIGIDPI